MSEVFGTILSSNSFEYVERCVAVTPLKINMEHNHGGLEDDFPFQIGDF